MQLILLPSKSEPFTPGPAARCASSGLAGPRSLAESAAHFESHRSLRPTSRVTAAARSADRRSSMDRAPALRACAPKSATVQALGKSVSYSITSGRKPTPARQRCHGLQAGSGVDRSAFSLLRLRTADGTPPARASARRAGPGQRALPAMRRDRSKRCLGVQRPSSSVYVKREQGRPHDR